jgi:hypothetical protein
MMNLLSGLRRLVTEKIFIAEANMRLHKGRERDRSGAREFASLRPPMPLGGVLLLVGGKDLHDI